MSVEHIAAEKRSELSPELLLHMYELMFVARTFDRRAVALQRQGRIGTFAPLEGQEAAQVGSALALRKHDFVFPSYREHAVMYIHGMPLSSILLYWNGRYEGCVPPEGVNLFPVAVPIATQIPHASGAALAAKLRNLDQVVITYFGDGATSEGDFHEGMNFAAVFQVPLVLFCQNNGYAISVPLIRQTRVPRIADKAAAYGMEGITVDGNDVIEVYHAVRYAVQKAATGGGPTLVEAVTYRIGSHTTADDPTRYRTPEEVEEWKRKDPLRRLELRLRENGLWSDRWYQETEQKAQQVVEDATKEMLAQPRASLDSIFQHVYAEPTPSILEQQNMAERHRQSSQGGRA